MPPIPHDHRRHGYSVFGKCRRLLPGIQRFGLYQAGPEAQRGRYVCHGHRGAENPKAFRAACDTFKLLEIISSEDAAETAPTNKGRANAFTASKTEVPSIDEIQKTITGIDEIQKAITKLLIENNSQNQPIILARVGNSHQTLL